MTALALVALLVLVAINGFFVAAEFALVRVRREKIETMADEGKRGAAVVLRQLDAIDRYLSACQLGITMASIGIGFLGEPALASLFEDPLGEVMGHGVAVAIAFAIAFTIATTLHITTGEQVPKIFAISRPETVARRIARPLQWFAASFRPFEWALTKLSNAMLRIVGVNAQAEFEEQTRSEDLKMLIARGVTGGTLDPGEAHMLSGVFHLHEQEARQVMTPIPAVVTVDLSEDAQTALRRCVDSGHTRLVVTEDENTDRVKGIVHNNSLARLLMAQGPTTSS